MNNATTDIIKEMKEYAQEYNVPIMTDEGIEFLINYIKEHKVKKILEIGTAIAYSTIVMAQVSKDITITSIERDEQRYLEALKNVKEVDLEKRITLIFKDALEVELEDMYDLIFIDAAKAQNIKFFQKFEKNLNNNGTIITDNMNFHGLVNEEEAELSRNLRQLVRKIKNYQEFLEENKSYESKILNIGDGIAVSIKK